MLVVSFRSNIYGGVGHYLKVLPAPQLTILNIVEACCELTFATDSTTRELVCVQRTAAQGEITRADSPPNVDNPLLLHDVAVPAHAPYRASDLPHNVALNVAGSEVVRLRPAEVSGATMVTGVICAILQIKRVRLADDYKQPQR